MTKERHEETNNIVFTCPEHGKESYFSIKKFEKHPKWGKDIVYVWFKDAKRGDEKMWCKIIKGDRKKGIGILDNQPFNVIQYKLGDKFKFKTDAEGITWMVEKV
tara:strand:+ start:54 stop:365 length:312 start_codon:yes stop_codon:yes gene_type:complete